MAGGVAKGVAKGMAGDAQGEVEPGCEWVLDEQAASKLQLPEFPNVVDGSFRFSMPPLPRLLPR